MNMLGTAYILIKINSIFAVFFFFCNFSINLFNVCSIFRGRKPDKPCNRFFPFFFFLFLLHVNISFPIEDYIHSNQSSSFAHMCEWPFQHFLTKKKSRLFAMDRRNLVPITFNKSLFLWSQTESTIHSFSDCKLSGTRFMSIRLCDDFFIFYFFHFFSLSSTIVLIHFVHFYVIQSTFYRIQVRNND